MKPVNEQFRAIDFNEGVSAALHYLFGLLFEYDNVQR